MLPRIINELIYNHSARDGVSKKNRIILQVISSYFESRKDPRSRV